MKRSLLVCSLTLLLSASVTISIAGANGKAAPPASANISTEKEPVAQPSDKLQFSGKALKIGMRGPEVEQVQKKLKEFGYYRDQVDGIFGSATFNSVYTFQSANGLTTDGVVGAQTVAALNLPKNMIAKPPAVDVSRGGSRAGLEIVAMARSFLGTPYVWGGRAPGGFDCSGFIYYIFANRGVSIPRMADGQFYVGAQIPRQNIQAGDLVFFTTYEPGPSHVGIYMGDGNFIHASSAAGVVTITSMSKTYYVERYLGARRLI